jgi:hypothetical protein
MAEEDQATRKEMIKIMAAERTPLGSEPDSENPRIKAAIENCRKIDAENRRRVAEIVGQYGWPGRSLVGRDGAGMAWLLVQHADKDVELQKHCLAMMQAATEGEVAPQHIAMLTDRVLVNQGLEQIYGTQMDGTFKPRPIKDVEHVDQRRAAMDLPPLEEYVKQAKAAYLEMSRP